MIDTERVHEATAELKQRLSTPDVGLLHEEAARRGRLRRRFAGLGIVLLLVVGGFGVTQLVDNSGGTRLDTASGDTTSPSTSGGEVPIPTTSDPAAPSSETPSVGVGVYDDFLALPLADAEDLAESEGVEWGIIRIDGVTQELETDHVPGRLLFAVELSLIHI